MESCGNQNQLNGLRALIEVGKVKPAPDIYVRSCSTFASAIGLSMSQQITHREMTQEAWAAELGVSTGTLSKILNNRRGGGIPHDFLFKLARVTGNYLPLQWLAYRLGFTLEESKQSRIDELQDEIARIRATG